MGLFPEISDLQIVKNEVISSNSRKNSKGKFFFYKQSLQNAGKHYKIKCLTHLPILS